ncbi:MAG: 2-hydroxyacyl-CoA dehydratase [Deltaproteobacteria bacterium]|nr:2-hydroxyacyl-CoA dehydratase [Deltaproteobacteria bacterium]
MNTKDFSLSIPSRQKIISDFKAKGGKIAAVFPIHYPRAIFRAFDILPVEVWGPPGVDTSPAATHLQVYACSIVHCGLSYLMAGKLDVADLFVVPHACDSLQGLGSLLLDFVKPDKPVLTFYLARGDLIPATDFVVDEIAQLADKLAEITGKRPTDSELAKAIEREEEADQQLAELFSVRRFLPVSDREFYQLVRAREYLPAELFFRLAKEMLDQKQDTALPEIPRLITGILPEPMDILDRINAAGGLLAADDLCCSGRRVYPPGKSEQPYRRMAESLLLGPADSTRGSPIQARIDRLLELARSASVKGVIFYNVKFCEPEQFDWPQIKQGLASVGLRTVEIEADISEQLPHQAITRVEAFLETLS